MGCVREADRAVSGSTVVLIVGAVLLFIPLPADAIVLGAAVGVSKKIHSRRLGE